MGQALYRKYRSRNFDEVIGQEHITTTLKNAIKSGRISHAYLFTGPKGVGKTTVARILAHEVNDLPYSDESIHLDIIEIDGASNRRIDEIRELRDKVHVSPTSARYKVYIIDEVHMLTREAFNALLKTLEEPPAHCIFILATTEAHKLPATIISRTQRFEFKPIASAAAVKHLGKIAKKEKIDAEPAALQLLAEHGQGSFRDSIGLLDQLANPGSKLTEAYVRQFLGLPPAELIDKLTGAITAGDSQAVLATLDQLREQGTSAPITARILAGSLRTKLVSGQGEDWIPALLKALIEIPASSQPEEAFEIAVLEASLLRPRSVPATSEPVIEDEAEEPEPDDAPAEEIVEPAAKAVSPKAKPGVLSEADWEQILEKTKKQAASLYTALRLATPSLDGYNLTLSFRFPLHQKKINQAKNKDLIGKIFEEVTGQSVGVKSIIEEVAKPDKAAKASEPSLENISNIFGQPEVLES